MSGEILEDKNGNVTRREKNKKKPYRQKYTTTEQTISQNYKVTNSAANAPHGRTENEKS